MIRRLFTTISKKDFPKIALNNPEFNQHELNSWINRNHKINPDNCHKINSKINSLSLISDNNVLYRCNRYIVYKDKI